MRVLTDACLPVQLAKHLPFSDVRTARQMGWQDMSNGQLLGMAQRDFDVILTMDKSIPSQQVLAQFSIGVIIIRARSNRLGDLIPLLPKVIAAVNCVRKGDAMVVEL